MENPVHSPAAASSECEQPQQPHDAIEAVIAAATSNARHSSHLQPGRDTRTQLFVSNLPYRVRWQDLKDLFRKAGTVLRADVSLGPDNRSRGYGTVLLGTSEDAGRAVDMFNGFCWMSRVLEVRIDRLPGSGSAPGSSVGSGSAPQSTSGGSELGEYPTDDFPTGKNLFVGNLPFHTQWQDLKDLFRQAGTIVRADVALGVDGRSRGFGTVSFATEQDAERAVTMFNGFEYNGRQLKVHHDKFNQATQATNPFVGGFLDPSSLAPSPTLLNASPNLFASQPPQIRSPSLLASNAGTPDINLDARPNLLNDRSLSLNVPSPSQLGGANLGRSISLNSSSSLRARNAAANALSLSGTSSPLANSMSRDPTSYSSLSRNPESDSLLGLLSAEGKEKSGELTAAGLAASMNLNLNLDNANAFGAAISAPPTASLGRPGHPPNLQHHKTTAVIPSLHALAKPVSVTIKNPNAISSPLSGGKQPSRNGSPRISPSKAFGLSGFLGKSSEGPVDLEESSPKEKESGEKEVATGPGPGTTKEKPKVHPGPISLPPLPSLPAHLAYPYQQQQSSASPSTHNNDANGQQQPGPQQHVQMGGGATPMSPGAPYYPQPGPGHQTPYAMPPITPSMPPFNFLPPGAPGTPGGWGVPGTPGSMVIHTPMGLGTPLAHPMQMMYGWVSTPPAPMGSPGGFVHPGTGQGMGGGFVWPQAPAMVMAQQANVPEEGAGGKADGEREREEEKREEDVGERNGEGAEESRSESRSRSRSPLQVDTERQQQPQPQQQQQVHTPLTPQQQYALSQHMHHGAYLFSPPLSHPHHPHAQPPMPVPVPVPHVFTPGVALSPGVAMSPGVFFQPAHGAPGSNRPMPAPAPAAYFSPGYGPQMQQQEYFPPMPPASSVSQGNEEVGKGGGMGERSIIDKAIMRTPEEVQVRSPSSGTGTSDSSALDDEEDEDELGLRDGEGDGDGGSSRATSWRTSSEEEQHLKLGQGQGQGEEGKGGGGAVRAYSMNEQRTWQERVPMPQRASEEGAVRRSGYEGLGEDAAAMWRSHGVPNRSGST